MAVQPLSPATDRRLGRPLPCQLSNQTRAHPCAINLWYYDHVITYTLCGINFSFPKVSPTQGQVAHALLTRPPLGIAASFDLNVLCTPPAFILSQDQTLEQIVFNPVRENRFKPLSEPLNSSLLVLSMCPVLPGHLFKRISRISTRKIFACTSFSCCSIVNDQSLPLSRQPEHYTTFESLCQEVFQKFFEKLFSELMTQSGGTSSPRRRKVCVL